VDDDDSPGRFILTGSQHFSVTDTINQSLAGRTALLKLLPLSLREMADAGLISTLDNVIFSGSYPRIHQKHLDPSEALAFYLETYVERDLRSILHVRDLRTFEQFLRLLATFVGQVLNLNKIAAACGIDGKTAKAWISVLEASFIVFLLPAYHNNLKKRLVKAPKLYFVDTGLACFLLSMKASEHVATHPLRGALFECLVVSDLLKERYNAVRRSNLYFYGEHSGREIDVVLDHGSQISLVEVKSSGTLHNSFFDNLVAYKKAVTNVARMYVVYGGTESSKLLDIDIVPWRTTFEIKTDLDS
jgi:uncharacterized protein